VVVLMMVAPARAQCDGQWVPFGAGQAHLNSSPERLTVCDPDGPGGQGPVLVVAGDFGMLGGATANGIAVWQGSSWKPTSGPAPHWTGLASTVFGGEILAGGWSGISYPTHTLAHLVGETWQWFTTADAGLWIRVLANYNGTLFAGTNTSIVRWDGAAWQATGASGGNPWAMLVHDGQLVAAGESALNFDLGTSVQHNIARWDGTGWRTMGGGSQIGGGILALAEYNGEVYAGGWMYVNNVDSQSVARWDGTAWHAIPGSPGWEVHAMTVYHGELIAGGPFTTVGSDPISYIARWDGAQWRRMGAGVNGAVFALTVYQDQLIVGGAFSRAGGFDSPFLARWVAPSADFDHDGTPGTDADIEAFFACLSGNCCPSCGSPDFNGDGAVATDADIEAFFRVLAGGSC
jgi:hypothetical protein